MGTIAPPTMNIVNSERDLTQAVTTLSVHPPWLLDEASIEKNGRVDGYQPFQITGDV